MPLDLGVDLSSGKWVEYQDGIEFKLRPVTPAYLNKSRLKHVKKKRWRGETEEEINQEAWNHEIYEYIILEWKGVVANGVEVECNKENKRKLTDTFTEISIWILEEARSLAEELAIDDEELVKN